MQTKFNITSHTPDLYYQWGQDCQGWRLVDTEGLSVIEEIMPPDTREKTHWHRQAAQFFRILQGIASFEIEGKRVSVSAGAGIHIPAGVVHCIFNDGVDDLIFLVISAPSTWNDRVEEEATTGINLHGKQFRALENSDNGEVSGETVFHYRQEGDVVWATYAGGTIRFGTLSGQISGSTLRFYYQHQNLDRQFKTGQCTTRVDVQDGKTMLYEQWQWTSGDGSSGTSVLVEM